MILNVLLSNFLKPTYSLKKLKNISIIIASWLNDVIKTLNAKTAGRMVQFAVIRAEMADT